MVLIQTRHSEKELASHLLPLVCARGETDIISAFEADVPGSNPGGRAGKT